MVLGAYRCSHVDSHVLNERLAQDAVRGGRGLPADLEAEVQVEVTANQISQVVLVRLCGVCADHHQRRFHFDVGAQDLQHRRKAVMIQKIKRDG